MDTEIHPVSDPANPSISIAVAPPIGGAVLNTERGDKTIPHKWRIIPAGQCAKAGNAYWHFGYHFWVVLAEGDYGCELIGDAVNKDGLFIERSQ